jgi:N-acetylmuramoyl-L-alanine amidase
MGELDCGRRRALRLLALGAAVGWAFEGASAQPAARGVGALRRLPTVVIDPGHGGIDPGAISPHGVYEKDIVLPTASEFARSTASITVATGL